MRNNLLQKRAFCAALFVLLLSVVGMKNAFAQTQVATLQHGDDISAYYGVNAFVAAHTAAADGDIITLSSGTFIPTTVTKAITLRGAGSTADTVAGTAPTTFASYMELNSANDSIPLIIEGILFSNDIRINILNNPRFLKCKFSTVSSLSSGSMQNGQFADCIIRNFSFFKSLFKFQFDNLLSMIFEKAI